jgi:hypothetical protein
LRRGAGKLRDGCERRLSGLGLKAHSNHIKRGDWIDLLALDETRVERSGIPSSEVNRLPDIAESIFCPAVMSISTSSLSPDIAIVEETPGIGLSPCMLS